MEKTLLKALEQVDDEHVRLSIISSEMTPHLDALLCLINIAPSYDFRCYSRSKRDIHALRDMGLISKGPATSQPVPGRSRRKLNGLTRCLVTDFGRRYIEAHGLDKFGDDKPMSPHLQTMIANFDGEYLV